MVLSSRFGCDARADIDDFLRRLGVEVLPFTPAHAIAATGAFLRFGRGYPAKLNFGDCMSYAVAIEAGMPLLFKGGDFAETDVPAAI